MKEKLYMCSTCNKYKSTNALTECDECKESKFEINRLAEIGRAADKLIKEKQIIYDVEFDRDNFSCEEIKTVVDLLEWYRKEVNKP